MRRRPDRALRRATSRRAPFRLPARVPTAAYGECWAPGSWALAGFPLVLGAAWPAPWGYWAVAIRSAREAVPAAVEERRGGPIRARRAALLPARRVALPRPVPESTRKGLARTKMNGRCSSQNTRGNLKRIHFGRGF